MDLLFTTLLVSLGIQIVVFVIAYAFQTDKFTDISYGLTFVILAVVLFMQSSKSTLHIILLCMILIWSARLGGYLLVRIHKIGSDKRFNEMRKGFFRFLGFWVVQGFTVWVVLITSILFFKTNPVYTKIVDFGIILWIAGLAVEGIADQQKYIFKNRTRDTDEFIQTGLWKYSRHPNYFGEFLMWAGIWVLAFSSLSSTQIVLAAISPLFILVMLLFVSGIPLLEKSYAKRYGKKWKDYKNKTSTFVPWPPKK